ncbi:response regulator transcription factor [Microbacterium caowuchunii]|uniref:response regulator transcription factor n=1 Tax=Microbacterium caowuchunii TaxID=2614638 RepID=UPI00177D8E6C|nr:response regulator transcription factor [Microbacterium caowuchunii]
MSDPGASIENRTRVAVVDDHQLVARAVGGLMAAEPELEFTRHAPSVAKLIGPRCDADVVILDLSLRDGTTPAESVRALQAWAPRCSC